MLKRLITLIVLCFTLQYATTYLMIQAVQVQMTAITNYMDAN